MLLAHAPHDGVLGTLFLTAPLPVHAEGIAADATPGTMAQTFATLNSHAGTSDGITFTPGGTMRGAKAGEFYCLGAVGEGTQFTLRAVGNADTSLHNTVHTAGGATFTTNPLRFGAATGSIAFATAGTRFPCHR